MKINETLLITNPPHNIEIEQEILGSIMQEPDLMDDVIDRIKYTDFHNEEHQLIYTALSYLKHNNDNIDYTNVLDRMKYKTKKEPNVDYVLGLTDCVASTVNFDYKVERLLDLSQKRDIYNISKYMLTEDIGGISSANLVKKIQDSLDNVNIVNNMEITYTKEYANEWLEEFNKPISNIGMKFGFKKLDEIITIETTGMSVIAGSTGSGKSAFGLAITRKLCEQGKKGLFITLEMSKKQVMNRLISNIARVEHDKIKNKYNLTKQEKERVEEAISKVASWGLIIYDRGAMNVDHLLNLCKKLKKQNQIDFLVVDYLQLMDSGKKQEGNENARVEYLSRKLKLIAQDLYIPVFSLSQLNRNIIDGKTGKKREPVLADLRSSGAVEQDANHVIMLHNKSQDKKNDPEDMKKSYIDILVRKNREGTTGKIVTTFYGDFLHFEEQEWDDKSGSYQPVIQENFDDIKENNDYDEDLPF